MTQHIHHTSVRLFTALFLGSALALAGCSKKADNAGQAKAPAGVGEPGGSVPVQVATVQRGTISDLIPVTGNLVALQDVQLSAKASGRVVAINVREGDFVHKGQLIVQQDTTDLDANVRQALANVLSAQSKVSQAITNYQIQVTAARQGVLQAKAQVTAAQENYLKVKRGSRPQEVLQSKNSLLSAKANVDNALITLNRDKTLFTEGAIAKAELDTAQTNYDVYVAQYKNAQQALSLVQEGSRQEDIATALAQVRQQQTALQNAISNQKQVSIRRDDITAAQAGVAQAKATLSFNQQQVQNAYIKSPIDGLVAARTTEIGQIAAPGTNLVRIVNIRSVYYQPTLSETDFTQAPVGTPVQVRIDALPKRVYMGRVAAVYPAASTSDRNFTPRVAIDNSNKELRPGMFARGQIVAREERNVPIVPATALVTDAAQQGFTPNTSSDAPISSGMPLPPQHVVVVTPQNTAQIRQVKIGIANQSQAEITGGLSGGERIVIVGQQTLKAGDKLAVQNGANAGDTARNASPPAMPTS